MLTKKDGAIRSLSHSGILSPSSLSVPLSRRTFSHGNSLEPSFGTVLMDPYLTKSDPHSEIASWADLTLSHSRPLSMPQPPASFNSGSSFSPTSPSHPVQETSTIKVDYDPITGNKRINQYEILRELGRGCHGKVKLGRDTLTEELVAIKIVHKNTRRRLGSRSALSTQMAKVQREIAILKKCNHPHVVQLKEVIDDPAARKIYLVLEYMDRGEVQFVDADLEKSTIRHILRNVIVGLEYLHRQGIIHRDIKPANLLWSQDGQVKISDFGVSYCRRQSLTSPQLIAVSSTTSIDDVSDISSSPPVESSIAMAASEEEDFELAKTAGSPAFFAPELCWSGDESEGPRPPITAAIDVWALGVTLYCLVFGTPPFTADSEYELFETIPRAPLSIPSEMAEDLDLVDLLQGLLCKDPLKRLTLAEARLHPWILADLPDPQAWARDADPDHYPKLEVSEDEVYHAVTLKERLRKHLRKLSESFLRTFGK